MYFFQAGLALDFSSGTRDWVSVTYDQPNCLTAPGTPGCERMTVALWIRVLGLPHEYDTIGGILTTKADRYDYTESGTVIYTSRYGIINCVFVTPENLKYEVFNSYPYGWFHTVLTLDTHDERMMRYVNGVYEDRNEWPYESSSSGSITPIANTAVFGRDTVQRDNYYGDFQVDEVLVFNSVLTLDDVQDLYAQY